MEFEGGEVERGGGSRSDQEEDEKGGGGKSRDELCAVSIRTSVWFNSASTLAWHGAWAVWFHGVSVHASSFHLISEGGGRA